MSATGIGLRADAALIRILEEVKAGKTEPTDAALAILIARDLTIIPSINFYKRMSEIYISDERVSYSQELNGSVTVHGETKWVARLKPGE